MLPLQTYYRETADFLVALREGGLALSAEDDDLVQAWHGAGIPLSQVLEAIRDEAKRNARSTLRVRLLWAKNVRGPQPPRKSMTGSSN